MDTKGGSELSLPQTNLKSEIQPRRNKVALKPGHSLMDWIRLTHSNKDLTGVGGKILNVTPEELAKHNTKNDAWISLKGKVYNVTPYMDFHPGGEDELMRGVGKDATMLFNEVHRWVNADSMLQKCLVGKLKVPAIRINKGIYSLSKRLVANVNTSQGKAINVNKTDICYHLCTLISKEAINHNTKIFIFSLPDTKTMLVPPGHHVHIYAVLNGVEVVRSYTPIIPSLDIPNDHPSLLKGRKLYLMIKIYPDGALTSFIDQIEVGGSINISNCDGSFDKKRAVECAKLILLAAGTGLTPMVKLIYYVLCDTSRERNIQLMFFNRQERDILWHTELDKLAHTNDGFQVTYVLSEPHSDWRGLTGHVSKSLLETFLPQIDNDILICICGPNAFTESCIQYLQEMEYSSSCIHAFLG